MILRRFDRKIADMHSQVQLAASDLYSVLIACQRLDEAMAQSYMDQFYYKLQQINKTTRDLRNEISLAREEALDDMESQ